MYFLHRKAVSEKPENRSLCQNFTKTAHIITGMSAALRLAL
jgi:hypothetical protein